MKPRVHVDVETRSACDLKSAGVYRYAQHSTTGLWGLRYRFEAVIQGVLHWHPESDCYWTEMEFDIGDGLVSDVTEYEYHRAEYIRRQNIIHEWRPGMPPPQDLLDHIAAGSIVVAHNAAFERTIWNWIIVHRDNPSWPQMTIQNMDCTMARAAAISYPQGLDDLAKALHKDVTKDKAGYSLMMKMAKPRKVNADGTITWWDEPENVDRLMAYCGQDVIVEEAVDKDLPPLSAEERAVWELDQTVNERGILFDEAAVDKVETLVAFAKKQNDKHVRDITDRAVRKCNNDGDIKKWLTERGYHAPSIAKDNIKDVRQQCKDDALALEVLDLRSEAWKTSTAKYTAYNRSKCSDGRCRGTLNYQGAGPGRWAGRLIQPHNMPRVDPDDELLQVQVAHVGHIMRDRSLTVPEQWEHFAVAFGRTNILKKLSQAIRSMLMAADGYKFVSGDFSNIEGRVNSWMAGDKGKLDAFRAYDNGTGHDLYKLAYARAFGVNVETIGKGRERQIGKVMELALGFQGGVNAFVGMGANYGLVAGDLVQPILDAVTDLQWDTTCARYEHARDKGEFTEQEWSALTIIKDNWRKANPAVVQSWYDYQDAAVAAVSEPGTVFRAGSTPVQYYSDQRILWAVLPSGRMIAYAEPHIKTSTRTVRKQDGTTYNKIQHTVHFSGRDGKTGRWGDQSLYGGLQCENVVQGAARDAMVAAMFALEAAGYPMVLHVHDEIVTEVLETRTDLNAIEFARIMSDLPAWADGLPVSVGAWEDKRYVK